MHSATVKMISISGRLKKRVADKWFVTNADVL